VRRDRPTSPHVWMNLFGTLQIMYRFNSWRLIIGLLPTSRHANRSVCAFASTTVMVLALGSHESLQPRMSESR
jgi:hypothetical protein